MIEMISGAKKKSSEQICIHFPSFASLCNRSLQQYCQSTGVEISVCLTEGRLVA